MNPPRCPLSVIVITRNEEPNIDECLGSVAWADEIVVVDAKSTDATASRARRYTENVFITDWLGYAGAKTFALAKAKHEWILWLDADERVTDGLGEEIRSVITGSPSAAGFEVARRAYFLGKWIRHCGWYPSTVVRLFKRSAARFDGSRVHEGLVVNGPVGRLRNDLLHYTDHTLYHYLTKFNSYTTLAAEDLADRGRRFSLADLLARPPYLFLKMYLLRRGFLDGMHGLVLSLLSAAYVFCKYAKLWDLQRLREGAARGPG